jgi:tetratricopeptide (TPR) repeat protein
MSLVVGAAALAAVATTARAVPTPEERQVARAHYEKAVNHFNANEYAAAAEEFLLVYKTAPQPALLFNAAQAFRLGNEPARALESYQAFLKAAPDARQRPDVERRIRDLQAQVATGPARPAAAPPDMAVAMPTTPPVAVAEKKGGGGSDRLQAVAEVIKANRAGFRACFDRWSKAHPGVNGSVALTFYLDPDGNLDRADADTKGFAAPEVERCIEDYSRTLHYPKSQSGKFTRFTYPFDFKATR